MDLKRINILLDRYWNCVSSIEEEEELKAFFRSNEVPDELKEAAALFRYYEEQKNVALGSKFDEDIIARIGKQQRPVIPMINNTLRNYLRVAAVILVVLTASFVFRMEFWGEDEKPPTLLAVDTYKTPEEAYAETKKAFMLIAEKLNSGRKQAEKISILNEAENKIKKEKQ